MGSSNTQSAALSPLSSILCLQSAWVKHCQIAPLLNNAPKWDFFGQRSKSCWNSLYYVGSVCKWKQHDSSRSLLIKSGNNKCNQRRLIWCTMIMQFSSSKQRAGAMRLLWFVHLPPYSPNLASCDHHIFGPLNYMVGGLPLMMMSRKRCRPGFWS